MQPNEDLRRPFPDLSNPKAMAAMYALIPDAKIIVVLRDPVSRAWSHYRMRRERGREQRSFQEGVQSEAAVILEKGPDER